MKNSRTDIIVILILSIIFSLFTFTSTSLLYPDEGSDSVIFKSIGLAILEGKTPYVDYFDHKGPVLYFINAAGQLICAGDSGIFLLEFFATFIVFLLLFQSARIVGCGKWCSWMVFGLSVLYYGISGVGGNTCEEWELLAISIATYLSLCYVCRWKSPPSFLVGVIFGICFSFCFFIRPNDAVSQIGGLSVGVVLLTLYRKEFLPIMRWGCGWALGAIIVSLPIFLYFLYRNAVGDFYYGLIYHNLIYAGNFINTLLSTKKIIMLLFFLVCLFLLYQNNKSLAIIFLPAFLFGWLLLGERAYAHYYTVFIPVVIAAIAAVFQDCYFWKKAFLFISFVFFFTMNVQSISATIWKCRYKLGAFGLKKNKELLERRFQQEGRRLIGLVPPEERDSIWNFNLSFNKFVYTGIFWKNGIVQMNRIPFYEMAFVDPKLAESDNIEKKKPLWITLTHENDDFCEAAGKDVGRLFNYFQPGYDFIEANYDEVARTDTTICDIELWKRKENPVNSEFIELVEEQQ